MDRGAWWAMVHGVAKSQTRLSDSLTHSLQSSLVSEPGTDRPSLTFLSRMTFWIILCWSSSESLRLTGPEPATSCPLPAQEEHLCRFLSFVSNGGWISPMCAASLSLLHPHGLGVSLPVLLQRPRGGPAQLTPVSSWFTVTQRPQ